MTKEVKDIQEYVRTQIESKEYKTGTSVLVDGYWHNIEVVGKVKWNTDKFVCTEISYNISKVKQVSNVFGRPTSVTLYTNTVNGNIISNTIDQITQYGFTESRVQSMIECIERPAYSEYDKEWKRLASEKALTKLKESIRSIEKNYGVRVCIYKEDTYYDTEYAICVSVDGDTRVLKTLDEIFEDYYFDA